MKTKMNLLFSLMLIVAFVLAACGGTAPTAYVGTTTFDPPTASLPTTQPAETNTPPSSATATESPTITSDPASTLAETPTPYPFRLVQYTATPGGYFEPNISGITMSSLGCDPVRDAALILVPQDHSNLVATCIEMKVDGSKVNVAIRDGAGEPFNAQELYNKYGGDWRGLTGAIIVKMPFSPTGKYILSASWIDDQLDIFTYNKDGTWMNKRTWEIGIHGQTTVTAQDGWLVGFYTNNNGVATIDFQIKMFAEISN